MERSGPRYIFVVVVYTGCKITARKKGFFCLFVFLAIFALLAGFFWYLHRLRDALSPVCGIFII